MKKIIPLLLLLVGVAVWGTAAWLWYNTRGTEQLSLSTVTVPESPKEESTPPNTIEEPDVEEPIEPTTPVSSSALLDVPFTPQAPHGNWDMPYQEACEEASAYMAIQFVNGRTIDSPDEADQALNEFIDYQEKHGYPADLTAEELALLMSEFYSVNATVDYDFDWNEIKQHIANGEPVIVPAAGQQLHNPNFTQPGPKYHMLVIIGYTPTTVITNDPGTRNGKHYEYDYDTLYSAIHDWNGGAVESGQKAIVIVTAR